MSWGRVLLSSHGFSGFSSRVLYAMCLDRTWRQREHEEEWNHFVVIRNRDAQKGPGQMKHQRDTPSVPLKAWLYLLKFLEHPKIALPTRDEELDTWAGTAGCILYSNRTWHFLSPFIVFLKGWFLTAPLKEKFLRNSELFSVVTEQILRYTLRFLLTTLLQLRTIHLTDMDERKKNGICLSQMWLWGAHSPVGKITRQRPEWWDVSRKPSPFLKIKERQDGL